MQPQMVPEQLLNNWAYNACTINRKQWSALSMSYPWHRVNAYSKPVAEWRLRLFSVFIKTESQPQISTSLEDSAFLHSQI